MVWRSWVCWTHVKNECKLQRQPRAVCTAAWEDGVRASPLQQEVMLLLGRTLRELGLQYSLPAIRQRTTRDVIEKAVAKQ